MTKPKEPIDLAALRALAEKGILQNKQPYIEVPFLTCDLLELEDVIALIDRLERAEKVNGVLGDCIRNHLECCCDCLDQTGEEIVQCPRCAAFSRAKAILEGK